MSDTYYTLKAEHMAEVIATQSQVLYDLMDDIETLPVDEQSAVREYVYKHIKAYNEKIKFLKVLYAWETKEVEEDGNASSR